MKTERRHRVSFVELALLLLLCVYSSGCEWLLECLKHDHHHPRDAGPQHDAGVMTDAASDGGAAPDAETDGGGALTPEAFRQGIADIWCRTAVRCEGKLGSDAQLDLYCHPRSLEEPLPEGLLAFPVVAHFDPEAAAACLDALDDDAQCTLPRPVVPEPCTRVYHDTRNQGAACNSDPECFEGRCEVERAGCGGVCVTRAGNGDFCASDHQCAPSLVCRNNACAAPGGEGDFCARDEECGDDFWCYFAQHECRPFIPRHESCSPTFVGPDRCEGSLVCKRVSADEFACEEGQENGEFCDGNSPCAQGNRCADARCAAVSLPGGPCEASSNCPDSHACLDGHCMLRPVIGQACSPDVGCVAPGVCFHCFEGACVGDSCVALQPGDACFRSNTPFSQCEGRCEDRPFPEADVCVPLGENGDACTNSEQCEQGLICEGMGGGNECTAC